jgi:hypothetical protein
MLLGWESMSMEPVTAATWNEESPSFLLIVFLKNSLEDA